MKSKKCSAIADEALWNPVNLISSWLIDAIHSLNLLIPFCCPSSALSVTSFSLSVISLDFYVLFSAFSGISLTLYVTPLVSDLRLIITCSEMINHCHHSDLLAPDFDILMRNVAIDLSVH
jgi:hypothetical protein